MRVEFFNLSRQFEQLRAEILPALERVCRSGQFVLGPEVQALERDFAQYIGTREAVAVNSGTTALHLALLGLGIGPGDEVITTPLTFIATAEAISYTGARPVFVDVDPQTRLLDPSRLTSALTSRTRAVVPVHLYGQPADMTRIGRFAESHGLVVIEDCAQAHGAAWQGRRVGAFGQAGCFSFYPGKNLGAYGEAGMVVTDDAALASRLRCLRDHGQRHKYHHEQIGYNYRMDAFQGAVLRIKLRHLDRWNRRRREIAEQYDRLLADLPLGLPKEPRGGRGVYHLYPIVTPHRDVLAAWLAQAGIGTGLHYPVPVHLQPAYADLGYRPGDFPVAERLAVESLSLPLFPEMTDEEVGAVADALKEWFAARVAAEARALEVQAQTPSRFCCQV